MWLNGKYGKLEEAKIISESSLVDAGDGLFTTDVVVQFTYKLSDLEAEKEKIEADKANELAKAPSAELIAKYEATASDIHEAIRK